MLRGLTLVSPLFIERFEMSLEYWKHPTQGRIWTGDFKKHSEIKDQLLEQGWTRIKSRDNWNPFKKSSKKKTKKK